MALRPASICRTVSVLLAVALGLAAQDSRKGPDSRELGAVAGRRFLGLYSSDVKIGCGAIERTVADDGLVFAINAATDASVAPRRLGASYSRVLDFDPKPPHQLRSATETIQNPAGESEALRIERRTLAIEGAGAVWTLTVSRRNFDGSLTKLEDETKRTAIPRYTIEDELRAERWVRGGAGAGASLSVPRLDLLTRKVRLVRVQVLKRATSRAPGVADSRIVLCTEKDDAGQDAFVAFRADGWPCFLELPRLLVARAEPDGIAQSAIGWDGHIAGPVIVQHPLASPVGTEKLELVATGNLSAVIASAPGQVIEKAPDGLTLRLDLRTRSEPLSAADRRKWTDPSADIPSLDREIVTFAKEAVQGAPTASTRDRLVALLGSVRETVSDTSIPDGLTAVHVLSHRRGGPRGRAILLVAAARALKIAAREVRGMSYEGGPMHSFFPHWWVEVEVDGSWLAIDPSSSQIPADVAHIRCHPLPESSLPVDRLSALTIEVKR